MSGFVDIYTVIFLVIAVVIFLRLRSVLGKRTGSERPPFDPYSRRDSVSGTIGNKVIDLPRRPAVVAVAAPDTAPGADDSTSVIAAAATPLADSLKTLTGVDRTFDPAAFVAGAKSAYEMIVTAFAEGDRKTLKQLLSRDVNDGFVAAMAERESRGETIEFKFVGIDKAEITAAAVKGATGQVTVRFLSKLVSATHDKSGKVTDGDPTHVGDVTDIWTFARDVTSRDPNWKLVATESVD
ncbi:MAG TPA: Tim44/TimA family putative adaptor protein [Bauldia sp.]